jgi:hypothetical protein
MIMKNTLGVWHSSRNGLGQTEQTGMIASQSTAAQMSVRAALAAIIVTALVSLSSVVPRSPDRVSWIAVFWLSVYASVMIAQAAWFGWRWFSTRAR